MTETAQKSHNQFGTLPVWDLSDLYPGKDSAEFKADLEKAKADAAKFEADFKRLDADGDGLFDPQLDRQAISHQQKPVSKIPTSSLTLHEIGGAIGSTVRDAVQSRGNTQRGHHLWTSLTPEQKQATIGRFNIEMSKRPSAL